MTKAQRSALRHVRVVLVRPQHEGNVGAAARAMLNMGLEDLVLVSPRITRRDPVRWMAHGAEQVVDQMRTVDSLSDALDGTATAVATTARRRRWRSWPLLDPPEAGALLAGAGAEAPGALVFGPEDQGLSNEDLIQCTHIARVDTDSAHTSLNLAQAVLLMCYELRCRTTTPRPRRQRVPADANQVDGTLDQLRGVLVQIEFFRGRNPTQVLATARQILSRTGLTREEMGFLRGALRKLSWSLDHPGDPERETADRGLAGLDVGEVDEGDT
jgi:tRNA (cytidine32/uridine32-2'-O)-methyltransferase